MSEEPPSTPAPTALFHSARLSFINEKYSAAMAVLAIDEVRRNIVSQMACRSQAGCFSLPEDCKSKLFLWMQVHPLLFEEAAKELWAYVDDAHQLMNILIRNDQHSLLVSRERPSDSMWGIPQGMDLVSYIAEHYYGGADQIRNPAQDPFFQRFRYYCGLVRRLKASAVLFSLESSGIPLTGLIASLIRDGLPIFPNLEELAWTEEHVPALGFDESSLSLLCGPRTKSLRLYLPTAVGTLRSWVNQVLASINRTEAVGLQELHIFAAAPIREMRSPIAESLHVTTGQFFLSLHALASRGLWSEFPKSPPTNPSNPSQVMDTFQQRWTTYVGSFMAFNIFCAGNEEAVLSVPDSLEKLEQVAFVAQHLQLTDAYLNLQAFLHSPTLFQPIPSPPNSLTGLLSPLFSVGLVDVFIHLTGVSFRFSEVELQFFGQAWPNLREFRLDVPIRSVDEAPTLLATYRFVCGCPHLLYLTLPAITTKDCLTAMPDNARVPGTPLLSLSTPILDKKHGTDDILDCLLRLFPSLQRVGSEEFRTSGRWRSITRGLEDRRQREAYNAVLSAIQEESWALEVLDMKNYKY
ncbi:hypothetical protein OH77DRAFT_1593899 [Trametes cingulata]|nr:hypothetical protein OH77DRAFT_1593899 [Trametes cingulata]